MCEKWKVNDTYLYGLSRGLCCYFTKLLATTADPIMEGPRRNVQHNIGSLINTAV